MAEAAADALPTQALADSAPSLQWMDTSLAGLDSLQGHWRSLGFDDTAHTDARGTIVDPREPLPLGPSPGPELPRISIDLPGSQPPQGETHPILKTGRPDLEVQRMLGEGGMGRVFLAWQHSLDREVAIKTLQDRAPMQYREALLSEGAVTGFLEHPSIIPVHAMGVHDDGRPVLVMKRVDGVPWDQLQKDPSHPAWEGWGGEARDRLEGHLEILMQVCNAAHFAHSRGVVHRDIKPQNVMIGRFGDVYLADWGLARRLDANPVNHICGTPGYMAPEMAVGSRVDVRTDVYLLGATLHEILTGRLRHTGSDVASMMQSAAASLPIEYSPAVPPDLAALANWATQRDPKDRPATAAVFRQAVADHLRHKSSAGLTASALPRLTRLRELIRDQPSQSEDTHQLQDQLFTETRFALTQALEEWPESPPANQALAELEALLALRRDRAAELERLARDLDPSVSANQRNLALSGLTAAAVGVSLPVVFKGPQYLPLPRELFLASLIPLFVVLMATLAFRHSLVKNAFNRRAAVGILTIVTAISLGRLIGLRTGVGSPTMLMYDSLLGAAVASFGMVTLYPWLRWIGATLLLSAVACGIFPAFAFLAFSLATSSCLVMGLIQARRVGVPPGHQKPRQRPS